MTKTITKCIIHLLKLMKLKSTVDIWKCHEVTDNHPKFRQNSTILEDAHLVHNSSMGELFCLIHRHILTKVWWDVVRE